MLKRKPAKEHFAHSGQVRSSHGIDDMTHYREEREDHGQRTIADTDPNVQLCRRIIIGAMAMEDLNDLMTGRLVPYAMLAMTHHQLA